MSVYVVLYNYENNEIAAIFDEYGKALEFIESAPEGKYSSIPEEWEVQ